MGAERVPQRLVRAELVTGMFVASNVRPSSANADIRSTAAEKYATAHGASISFSNPLTKAAFEVLNRCWPEALAFAELQERSSAALGRSSADPAETQALANDLLNALTIVAVSLHREPGLATGALSDRPVGFAPARHYASRGLKRLPNARHETLPLEDIAIVLLTLLDGSRDLPALVTTVTEQILAGKLIVRVGTEAVTDAGKVRTFVADIVRQTLASLKDRAFLVG